MESHHWHLPDEKTFKQLEKQLAPHFGLRRNIDEPHTCQLLDDHDWDLWHAGMRLYLSAQSTYTLVTANGEFNQEAKGKLQFWWDFPEGEMRQILKPIIDLRALTPICALRVQNRELDLLDDEEKTVVRLRVVYLFTASNSDTPSHQFLSLIPLRGYKAEFQKALLLCEPLLSEKSEPPELETFLRLHGIAVKGKPKRDFGIDGDAPAEKMVRKMCLSMFTLARHNEKGVIDDIDTEFLHQYRVSIRKARSLINLMKKSLPADVQARLKMQLADMVGPTNALRDLDVFLLDKSYYQSLLPESHITGLENLFKHFTQERQNAQKRVARFFKSKAYSQLHKKVETELRLPPALATPAAETPILVLAKKRILNRYKKVCVLGNAIDDTTPDEDIHQLRIECKKLRYLMEFFAELFPKKQIATLTKSLKGLQNILGNFNDYSVQKTFLSDYLSQEEDADTIAAINGLIAVLHQKQLQERMCVCAAFAEFSQAETSSEFNHLFAKEENS